MGVYCLARNTGHVPLLVVEGEHIDHFGSKISIDLMAEFKADTAFADVMHTSNSGGEMVEYKKSIWLDRVPDE